MKREGDQSETKDFLKRKHSCIISNSIVDRSCVGFALYFPTIPFPGEADHRELLHQVPTFVVGFQLGLTNLTGRSNNRCKGGRGERPEDLFPLALMFIPNPKRQMYSSRLRALPSTSYMYLLLAPLTLLTPGMSCSYLIFTQAPTVHPVTI